MLQTTLGAVPPEQTAILFALPEEAAPFARRAVAAPYRIEVSGVGRFKAERAAHALLDSGRYRLLLICGFAGGLQGRPGDLILPKEVVLHSASPRALRPDADLLAFAQTLHAPAPLHTGTLCTVERVLASVEAKRALRAETQAIAVDMETAGAAQVAEERGVPWLALRAVTDGIADALPFDFDAYTDAEGNVNRNQVVLAALTRPWKIPALIQLGGRSARAAKNLATFLETLLQERNQTG